MPRTIVVSLFASLVLSLGLFRRGLSNPGTAVSFVFARLRGEWFRLMMPLLGHRFKAGKGLQIRGRLLLRGPGRVEFGDNVQIWEKVTPWTHRPDAVIRVGDGTVLAGTRFGCAESITVGRDCIIADCRIMDTDFHSLHPNRHDPAEQVRVAAVVIEDNVWLAAEAAVLPGTRIGTNSVAAFRAVCSGRYPQDVIVVGNPGRVSGSVIPRESRPQIPKPADTTD